jgi:hypothetical protein
LFHEIYSVDRQSKLGLCVFVYTEAAPGIFTLGAMSVTLYTHRKEEHKVSIFRENLKRVFNFPVQINERLRRAQGEEVNWKRVRNRKNAPRKSQRRGEPISKWVIDIRKKV